MRAADTNIAHFSRLNEEQQKLISHFLTPAFRALDTSAMTSNFKVIALRAMMSEIALTEEQEQEQFFTEYTITPYIKMIRSLVKHFGVTRNTGNCFLDSPDILGILFYGTPDQNLTQNDIQEFIAAEIRKKINHILPSLEVMAANRFVNAVLRGEHCENFPLKKISLIRFYANTALEPNPSPSFEAVSAYVKTRLSSFIIEAIDRQVKALKEIREFRAKMVFDKKCLSFKECQLDDQGNIDVEASLLVLNEQHYHVWDKGDLNKFYKASYLKFARLLAASKNMRVGDSDECLSENLSAASENGDLQVLNSNWEKASAELKEEHLAVEATLMAADGGHLHVLKWRWEKASPLQQEAMLSVDTEESYQLISTGNIPLLEWFWQHTSPEQHRAMLTKDELDPRTTILEYALRSGNLHVILWLLEKATLEEQNDFLSHATSFDYIIGLDVGNPSLSVAKWLWQKVDPEKKTLEFVSEIFRGACEHLSPVIPILGWLKDHYSAEQFIAFLMAEECSVFRTAGNLDTQKWLWENAPAEQQAAMLVAGNFNAFRNTSILAERQFLWSKFSAEQQRELWDSLQWWPIQWHFKNQNPSSLHLEKLFPFKPLPEQKPSPNSPAFFKSSAEKRAREPSEESLAQSSEASKKQRETELEEAEVMEISSELDF